MPQNTMVGAEICTWQHLLVWIVTHITNFYCDKTALRSRALLAWDAESHGEVGQFYRNESYKYESPIIWVGVVQKSTGDIPLNSGYLFQVEKSVERPKRILLMSNQSQNPMP